MTEIHPRDVAVRAMTQEDIPAGMRLARSAGWNQVVEDWHLFLTHRPGGCFVAERRGQVIGTVTTLDYGLRQWVSMLLVDPGARRQGIGSRLFERAIASLDSGREILLDATPAGRRLYERRGFAPLFGMQRMGGQPANASTDRKANVTPLQSANVAEIAALDRWAFGADRAWLLAALLQRCPQLAWKRSSGGRITGFVLGRRGAHSDQIGPLVARDLRDAQSLFMACERGGAARPLALDVPDAHAPFRRWLNERGLKAKRPFTRMVLGGESRSAGRDRPLPLAIAGPELG